MRHQKKMKSNQKLKYQNAQSNIRSQRKMFLVQKKYLEFQSRKQTTPQLRWLVFVIVILHHHARWRNARKKRCIHSRGSHLIALRRAESPTMALVSEAMTQRWVYQLRMAGTPLPIQNCQKQISCYPLQPKALQHQCASKISGNFVLLKGYSYKS